MRNNKTEFCIVILFVFGFTGLQAQTVTDIDSNVYKTVTIGTQVWMAENLKTTKYCNGDLIGTTTPSTLDISKEITPKYQWAYDGIESNIAIYGRLYTFYAITDSRRICPTGWHVPSVAEWTTLTTYIGTLINGTEYLDGALVAGRALKESEKYWPNLGADNFTGFTALPGGYRRNIGTYINIGKATYFWTSTQYSLGYFKRNSGASAFIQSMYYNDFRVIVMNVRLDHGNSVRCLRDK